MPTAWKGTISFGLVNIPITLTPTFKSRDLEFHMLHKKDHGRIGYQKVCKKCGKIVEQAEIIKGFEHEKDAYVPLEKEDLEAGKAPNTRNLEISLFVKAEEIDTKLYERPYYVMPDKKAENLYVLLREAIRDSGMVGVGKIQFGNKEHLAALKADGAAIILNLMHFIEEMEDPKQLGFPPVTKAVGKQELDLAKQLVGTLKGHFKAEAFRNAHQERLEETIRKKVGQARGKAGKVESKQMEGKVIDLMDRLKQSLAKGQKGSSAKGQGAVAEAKEPAHSEKHYHRKKAG
jgi:DNA end-binding protein Ku